MRKRLIVIALIVMISILTVGAVVGLSDSDKTDTKLKIKAKSPLHEGDSIKIKLSDVNNTPLANQTINVTITDEDNESDNSSLVTNDRGVCKLKIDKDEGKYSVRCVFAGNGTYNATEKTKKITVEEVEEDTSDYDPGAFYSEQAGRVIYTGEVQEGPDGCWYEHQGYNEWVRVG